MMERSMMVPEGRRTGSVISVSISGSAGTWQGKLNANHRWEKTANLRPCYQGDTQLRGSNQAAAAGPQAGGTQQGRHMGKHDCVPNAGQRGQKRQWDSHLAGLADQDPLSSVLLSFVCFCSTGDLTQDLYTKSYRQYFFKNFKTGLAKLLQLPRSGLNL